MHSDTPPALLLFHQRKFYEKQIKNKSKAEKSITNLYHVFVLSLSSSTPSLSLALSPLSHITIIRYCFFHNALHCCSIFRSLAFSLVPLKGHGFIIMDVIHNRTVCRFLFFLFVFLFSSLILKLKMIIPPKLQQIFDNNSRGLGNSS